MEACPPARPPVPVGTAIATIFGFCLFWAIKAQGSRVDARWQRYRFIPGTIGTQILQEFRRKAFQTGTMETLANTRACQLRSSFGTEDLVPHCQTRGLRND